MEKLREIYIFVAFAMGTCSLILAVFHLWNGKVWPGFGLVVAFVVCGGFLFLSQIKTFKFWEVQFELIQTLDQAKEVMDRLRRLSAISAKSTYMQMAWGNRLGTPPVREKQSILDEIDSQLRDLNAKPAEIAAIKKPFVKMIKLDFYFLYVNTIRAYAEPRYMALVERANRSPTPENIRTREMHSEKISGWTARTNDPNPFLKLENSSLEITLSGFTPADDEWLDVHEREVAEDLKRVVITLNADCEAKGGYTEQAAAYYDKYSEHTGVLAREVFANVLNGIRR